MRTIERGSHLIFLRITEYKTMLPQGSDLLLELRDLLFVVVELCNFQKINQGEKFVLKILVGTQYLVKLNCAVAVIVV